jgi:transketolase N-terminal domain/subunit
MITDYQRSLMEHSLGGKDPKKWHRNYFMASPGHMDLPDLRALEKHGMMKQVTFPSFCDSDSMLFMVTDAGKRFLSDNL